MENRSLLMAYLAVWIPYVVSMHSYARSRRLSHGMVAVSHSAPSLVAITMACIFLLGHGATVAQLAVGNERSMDLWSLWVSVWPLLSIATFVSGAMQTLWMVGAALKRESRPSVPVAVLGAAMSAFAFMTVLSNFPDA